MKETIEFETATTVYKSLHGLALNICGKCSQNYMKTPHGLSGIPTQISEYLALQPHTGNAVSHIEVSPCGIN